MRQFQVAAWSIVLTLGIISPAYSQDYQQKYTPWAYDQQQQRYSCEYHFTPAPNAPIKKQLVIYYPQQQKNNWLYYYNPEKKVYWGRCAAEAHPQYDASQMQWSYMKEKKWTDLSASCPTIPGAQDGPEIIPPPPPPPGF